jgi:hypothetical protein
VRRDHTHGTLASFARVMHWLRRNQRRPRCQSGSMRAIVGAIGLTRSGLLLFAGDKRFSPPASYRRRRRHARFALNSKRLRLFENATGGKWGTLFFGGRKYGDYNLSSHGNQRIQADAWGVNPGVGWYVTTPNPFSPNGRQIQAAGPIYNTEGGSEAGFNTVELDGPNPSPTPTPCPSASPANKP